MINTVPSLIWTNSLVISFGSSFIADKFLEEFVFQRFCKMEVVRRKWENIASWMVIKWCDILHYRFFCMVKCWLKKYHDTYRIILLGRFSISYLETRITWNFATKSLDGFLSTSDIEAKGLGNSNIVICILYLLKFKHVTFYGTFYKYMGKRQSAICSLIIYVFSIKSPLSVGHYGAVILTCHNSVDADTWQCQKAMAREK